MIVIDQTTRSTMTDKAGSTGATPTLTPAHVLEVETGDTPRAHDIVGAPVITLIMNIVILEMRGGGGDQRGADIAMTTTVITQYRLMNTTHDITKMIMARTVVIETDQVIDLGTRDRRIAGHHAVESIGHALHQRNRETPVGGRRRGRKSVKTRRRSGRRRRRRRRERTALPSRLLT